MAAVPIDDFRAQLREISSSKTRTTLYAALTNLALSLVMGVERYLRKFEAAQALPILSVALEKHIEDAESGDIMVMIFRSISLIMEHVPSSYDSAQEHHKTLMRAASRAIHRALCAEWRFAETDTDSLYEECLKTMKFVAKDDRTGTIIRQVLVGDLLTLCAQENSLLARQGLETLYMLCTKIVMPSEFEKPVPQSGFLSLFKSKKKPGKSHKVAVSVDMSDNPIVINVENVIAPFMQTLIEQHTAALLHVPEAWGLLELAIQCFGTLMERALLCHRPHTAHTLGTKDLATTLFRVIVAIESNVTLEAAVRNERTLFAETILSSLTSCHRDAMAETLLKEDAKKFFHSILEDANSEITTLLDDPFPLGVMAARSTQRRDKDHITSVAAIRLLVLATPNVPPEAFGLKPKTVLPVHQWMWEDELRHANRLAEEQSVTLETSWSRLSRNGAVIIHTNALPADLLTMTMARGFSGGFRNISRSFVPFVYHFVDEASVRPTVAVKETGSNPVNTALTAHASSGTSSGLSSKESSAGRKGSGGHKASLSATHSRVVMNEEAYVPEAHIAIAEEYFVPLCVYATHTSGQMAKQLATCACASILQMLFLSNADARVAKLMQTAILPMCEMFTESLVSADKATKAVVLTMTEWLMRHAMAANWGFCETSQRCGFVRQLESMAKAASSGTTTQDTKQTRTANLAEKAADLHAEICAVLQKQRNGSRGGDSTARSASEDTVLLEKATAALLQAAKQPGLHEKTLREFFDAVLNSRCATSYEIYQMDVASAALTYLLDGRGAEELLGPSFTYTSGGSGSTFSRTAFTDRADSASFADDQLSPAAALLANGMRFGAFLHLHASYPRLQAFAKLVASSPASLQQLVAHLVGTLPLQSSFPLVESVVTQEKVVCRPPLQAFQALSDVSPRVVLCGKAGNVASAPYASSAITATAFSEDAISTVVSRNVSSYGIGVSHDTPNRTPTRGGTASASVPASRQGPSIATRLLMGRPTLAPTDERIHESITPPGSATVSPTLPSSGAQAAALDPKCFCMRGHRLRDTPIYTISCLCDVCKKPIQSGWACRVCYFDICRPCYATYKGNPSLIRLMQTPLSMPRNRASLIASVGDIERYFRTGSTSTKGTQVAPTSQSSLQHLDRFTTCAERLLARRAGDGGETKEVVEVAKLLLGSPALLRKTLHTTLQTFYTRGELPGDPGDPGAVEPVAPGMSAEDSSPLGGKTEHGGSTAVHMSLPTLTDAQQSIASQLALEAIEDRYILYRPTIGRCAYQETLLSIIYRRAFFLGQKQVLVQLENCLLRHESNTEPITLHSSLRTPNSVADTPLNSSMATGRQGSGSSPVTANNASLTSAKTADRAAPPFAGAAGTDETEEEFTANRITPQQNFVFHHFDTDSAARCSCGQHSRQDFATKETNAMALNLPDFARRSDVLLLIFLYRYFYSTSFSLLHAGLDSKKLDVTVFENSAITTAVVKSLEASALLVVALPPLFALPRWVSFVLSDARFLIPSRARERIARYLAYGARRSFVLYMRLFRQYRLDRTVSIAPGEWARMSNHKFTVNRAQFLQDGFTVLRKCADARLPVSVEFKGDVGVGQGPTAQFYTLLAQEVCKSSLHLWRNTKIAAVQAGKAPTSTSSTPSKRVSPSGSSTSPIVTHQVPVLNQHPTTIGGRSSQDVQLVVPPPEGLFPQHVAADGDGKLEAHTPAASSSSSPNSSKNPASPNGATASMSLGSTRRLGNHGQIELIDPRTALRDYMQTQKSRATAFYTVGAALGRAFIDQQVFPLPMCSGLSVLLRSGLPPYKLSLPAALCVDKEAEVPFDLNEFPLRVARLVDTELAHSMETLENMDDATLQALDLPFTFPGVDNFELIPGGAKVIVTRKNLKRYQRRVVNALLYQSVAFPMRMLIMGCRDVVPLEALAVMEVTELTKLLCGEEKTGNEPLWTRDEIRSVLVGDHGYQNDSPQLDMLGNILGKRLTPKEQRAFLLFCTGCPRLPVGGIRALGAITVVKRSNAFAHASSIAAERERSMAGNGGGGDEDDEDGENETGPLFGVATMASDPDASSTGQEDNAPRRTHSDASRGLGRDSTTSVDGDDNDSEWALPSVNTCFRYLKLPPYPNEELLYKKLLFSITQCGDTFELS